MPSTIGKCELFTIKHIALLEGKTFLRNKHKIAFFEIKCTFFGREENTIRIKHTAILEGETILRNNALHHWVVQIIYNKTYCPFRGRNIFKKQTQNCIF